MKFSKFGEKFTQKSGILQLMDDLGEALMSDKPINMLGGGNPAVIDAVNEIYQQTYDQCDNFIESAGNYSKPQGDAVFIQTLADFFNRHYADQWQTKITSKNIALTNGSQNAFFYLLNLFAGAYHQQSQNGTLETIDKKILLPLVPEYIGYSDVHVDGHHFVASKPSIEEAVYTNHAGETLSGFYKYRVDFTDVEAKLATGNIGAICCSRPTNPTGNVLTDIEMQKLDTLAKAYDIPLIIDNAYGMPFPNILFAKATLSWNDNSILCFSLSKTGLPGLRTGIIVAHEKVIEAVSALNAIINLSPTRFGAAIASKLIENDDLVKLSNTHIQPFYHAKVDYAIGLLKAEFKDYPVKIHQPEGAMFLWLWFEGLPISTKILYEQLKQAGTIIVPGEYYFPGIDTQNYPHAQECIRMSYAQSDETLAKGIAKIGELVRASYDVNPNASSL